MCTKLRVWALSTTTVVINSIHPTGRFILANHSTLPDLMVLYSPTGTSTHTLTTARISALSSVYQQAPPIHPEALYSLLVSHTPTTRPLPWDVEDALAPIFAVTCTLCDTPLAFNPNIPTYHSQHSEHAEFGALPDPYTYWWSENLTAHPDQSVTSIYKALRHARKSATRHPSLIFIIPLLENIHRLLRPEIFHNTQTFPAIQILTCPYGTSRPTRLYLMIIHHPHPPPQEHIHTLAHRLRQLPGCRVLSVASSSNTPPLLRQTIPHFQTLPSLPHTHFLLPQFSLIPQSSDTTKQHSHTQTALNTPTPQF